ncbi:MAG: hypothetical protein HYU63_05700 [Armatimonadetes bacterium]|nr:hypothetical protein [Armatimonadota bacterium]
MKILFIAFLSLIFLIILGLIFHNPYRELKNINSKGKVIVAFGNSITAGFGIDKSKAFPRLIEDKLGEKVINSGISGNTTEDALRRIEKDVLQFEPKIVLVELGGNDFLQQFPKQTTQINLEKIVDIIQKEGAIVILIGAPSLGGSLYFKRTYRSS